MTQIRFLLDENMSRTAQDQLRLREPAIEVLCVGDAPAPALGTPDPAILEWIDRHGYVLVSQNRRTIPGHLHDHLAQGGHVPGIFLLQRRCPLGELLNQLILIWHAAKVDEYQDRIEYLPL